MHNRNSTPPAQWQLQYHRNIYTKVITSSSIWINTYYIPYQLMYLRQLSEISRKNVRRNGKITRRPHHSLEHIVSSLVPFSSPTPHHFLSLPSFPLPLHSPHLSSSVRSFSLSISLSCVRTCVCSHAFVKARILIETHSIVSTDRQTPTHRHHSQGEHVYNNARQHTATKR